MKNIEAVQNEVTKYGDLLYAEFEKTGAAINRAGVRAFVRLHALNGSDNSSVGGSRIDGTMSRMSSLRKQPIPPISTRNENTPASTSGGPREYTSPPASVANEQISDNSRRTKTEWVINPTTGNKQKRVTLLRTGEVLMA